MEVIAWLFVDMETGQTLLRRIGELAGALLELVRDDVSVRDV